jgi:hypothetical protein
MTTQSPGDQGGAPALFDLEPTASPAVGMISTKSITGPKLTPKQIIYFYSPDEWEEFTLEWAGASSAGYVAVKRLGGANDKGADVAGFLTDAGFEGQWDCIQCKHYDDPLTPGVAWPEILKMFRAVIEGHYTLPRRYILMAPRQCGPTLEKLLSSPSKLKAEFLKKLDEKDALTSALSADLLGKIKTLAAVTDFALFESAQIEDVLKVHQSTRHYVARFGAPLLDRPPVKEPPGEFALHETRYVEQLLEIYKERYPGEVASLMAALAHERTAPHFRRQREAFYSAEALRLFARDSVPDGTYDALQTDVFNGVIETVERDFVSGWERLTTALERVVALSLNDNALVAVSDMRDRKGICHQLANEDRLRWCRE